MKMIEYVEIDFRANIAYLIAHKYGSDGHRLAGTFIDSVWADSFNSELDKNLAKTKDLFITHHYDRYQGKFPIWVSVEVLQFSWLSKLYSKLKISDQKEIAKKYNVHPNEVSNWLHFLSITRNRCAHYSRLFNYTYPIHIKFRKTDKERKIDTNKVFSAIFNMKYLITDYSSWNSYIAELEALIEKYSHVDVEKLGFNADWRKTLSTL